MNGQAWRLGLPAKLRDSLYALAFGPALAALAVIATLAWRRWRARRAATAEAVLLDVMILAGLAAALAPTPTYRQYFMPLLPPLFLRLGMELEGVPAWPARWRRAARAGLGLGALCGLGYFLFTLGGAVLVRGWPVARVPAEARWIGRTLREAGVRGPVAALSPRIVLDSGYDLDRRFAMGVFVYRTADPMPPAMQARLHVVSPATQDAFFAKDPPAAIVVGYETGSARINPEDRLRAWAVAHGWRHAVNPHGKAEVYIPPAAP